MSHSDERYSGANKSKRPDTQQIGKHRSEHDGTVVQLHPRIFHPSVCPTRHCLNPIDRHPPALQKLEADIVK
jgi:hypothetical protein